MIFVLAFFLLPFAFGRIEDLRDRYEKRGDIARIEPGQFQESANGDRVFFIERNSDGKQTGNNVFIATSESGKETVTSARSGEVTVIGPDKFLVLHDGQRLERSTPKPDLTVSEFQKYGVRVGADDASSRSYAAATSISTLELLETPTPKHLGELSWRIGLVLAAINFIVLGIATSGVNPRAGRVANLGFAFLTFVAYFNLLILGKSWVESSQVPFGLYLLALHGGALVLGLLWLAKRHNNWVLRFSKRHRGVA